MAMLFLSHRPPRGIAPFLSVASHARKLACVYHPLPACMHWPMDLCPSAGDVVTKARHPTRRLIGSCAGQFSVMPRTRVPTLSTGDWGPVLTTDCRKVLKTICFPIPTGQNWQTWQPPSQRSRWFSRHSQQAFRMDGGGVANWTGGFSFFCKDSGSSHLSGNPEAVWTNVSLKSPSQRAAWTSPQCSSQRKTG